MGRKPRYSKSTLAGVLVVDKPLGWSSMDVVRRVRKAGGWVKTGHAGTLDPLATGVVVCLIGKATKCVPIVMAMPKVYETTIDLSAFTNTDDREGEREEIAVSEPPTRAAVEQVLREFVGAIEQVPPKYCAVHVDGQRAYKLARAGQEVELEARSVQIDSITLTDFDYPELTIQVVCGRGMHVRGRARDIGRRLGTGGHRGCLVRTAVGTYTLEQAVEAARLLQPIRSTDLLPIPAAPAPDGS